MIQNKITISLFLSGAFAAAPTPGPANPDLTAPNKIYQFTSGNYPITSEATKQTVMFQANAPTTSTTIGSYTGLYGCLRSGHIGLPTQTVTPTLSGTTSTLAVTTFTTIAVPRAFYQTKATQVGKGPKYIAAAASWVNGYDIPWADSTKTGYESGVGGDTEFAKVSGDMFECCKHSQELDKTSLCLTLLNTTSSSATTKTITMGTAALATRIVIYESGNTKFAQLASNQLTTSAAYDTDFILGAMAQQQENTATASLLNWCSDTFLVTTSTTEKTVKAQQGFNAKTKCTWQFKSTTSKMAPQFKLMDPLTNTSTSNYQLQWIEMSINATMGNLILPATNGIVGNYAAAGGIFFNPITATAGTFSTVYDSTASDKGFGSCSLCMGGSPGKFTPYVSGGSTLHLKMNDEYSRPDTQQIKPFYTSYDAAVLSFNALATPYNTARTAKTAAIAAKKAEKDIPKVPVRPCKPTPLPAIAALNYVADPAIKDPTTQYAAAILTKNKGKDVYFYNRSTTGTLALSDSQRKGYLTPNIDTSVAANSLKYHKDASVGHIFGRFGQGLLSLPNATAPFKWGVTSVAAEFNTMQVSIFPDGGSTFLGAVVNFPVTQSINISHSEATFGLNTSIFTIPKSSAAALVVLTAVEFASVISLSAVAMAATAATLY